MKKITLFLMSLFLTVGAMAQTPILSYTNIDISNGPIELSDDDAAIIRGLKNGMTVVVDVNVTNRSNNAVAFGAVADYTSNSGILGLGTGGNGLRVHAGTSGNNYFTRGTFYENDTKLIYTVKDGTVIVYEQNLEYDYTTSSVENVFNYTGENAKFYIGGIKHNTESVYAPFKDAGTIHALYIYDGILSKESMYEAIKQISVEKVRTITEYVISTGTNATGTLSRSIGGSSAWKDQFIFNYSADKPANLSLTVTNPNNDGKRYCLYAHNDGVQIETGDGGATYTFSVAAPYKIKSYSFDVKANTAGNNITATDGTTLTISNDSQHFSVDNINSNSTSFELTGTNSSGNYCTNFKVEIYEDYLQIIDEIGKGTIGYPADSEIETYTNSILAAKTADAIKTAKTNLYASNNTNMPIDGKAYTLKNVLRNSSRFVWLTYNGNGILDVTANEANATAFVCRKLNNGKYVFVNNDGKYLIWRGSGDTGSNNGDGYHTAYDTTNDKYTDIAVEKMRTGNYINGDLSSTRYVCLTGRRSASDQGYFIHKNENFTFDNSNAPYYRNDFSSAFVIEEAEYPNAPSMVEIQGELVKAGGSHIATFSAPFPTVIPEGVTAYYATLEEGATVVTINPITEGAIPANTGVILVGNEAGKVAMRPVAGESIATCEGNVLGNSAGVTKEFNTTNAGYILAVGNEGVGFYACKTGTLAMNKSYLNVTPSTASMSVEVRMPGATAIEEVETEAAETVIYDLSGRRINEITEAGIYVVNGKKVLVK